MSSELDREVKKSGARDGAEGRWQEEESGREGAMEEKELEGGTKAREEIRKPGAKEGR